MPRSTFARLVAGILLVIHEAFASPAWGAVISADGSANVSAGRNTGQVTKSIMPDSGSVAVTIGAAASDSLPREPMGFHEYTGIVSGSGIARYGELAGRAHAEASSRPNGDFDPYGAGGSVALSLGFLDTVEVLSNTLSPGTPVTLTFVMTLDASAIHFADGPFTPGRIGASARNEATIRDLESGNSTPSLRPYTLVNTIGDNISLRTFQFESAVGNHLEIDVDLMVVAGAIIDPFPGLGAASQGISDVIADNTAHFFYQPSGNVQLMAESGFNYALPPLPGDYGLNGTVDAADYVIWRKNDGTTIKLPNDPTGGTIGTSQYNTWRSNFGLSAGDASAASFTTAIPEPANWVAATLATFGYFLIARRTF